MFDLNQVGLPLRTSRRQRFLMRGVTSIEYALMASLIAIAIVSGVTAAGGANAFNWSVWVGKVLTVLGA